MSLSFGALAALGGASKGSDLINNFATTWFSNYLGRKNEKLSLERQYRYAERYAKNGPSWNVEGLRRAGLNPILAATDGAFSSPTVPSVGHNNPSGSDGSRIDLAGLALQFKSVESTIDINRSQAFKNFAEGLTKLKNGGLSGGYGAIKTLASSFGINDSDAQKILKDFGFTPPNPLGLSVPDGSKSSPHGVKSRNAPDDGKHFSGLTKRTEMIDSHKRATEDTPPSMGDGKTKDYYPDIRKWSESDKSYYRNKYNREREKQERKYYR